MSDKTKGKLDISKEVGDILKKEDIAHTLQEFVDDIKAGKVKVERLMVVFEREDGKVDWFGSAMCCLDAMGLLECTKCAIWDYIAYVTEEDENGGE